MPATCCAYDAFCSLRLGLLPDPELKRFEPAGAQGA
jgi:hypothetical protein